MASGLTNHREWTNVEGMRSTLLGFFPSDMTNCRVACMVASVSEPFKGWLDAWG